MTSAVLVLALSIASLDAPPTASAEGAKAESPKAEGPKAESQTARFVAATPWPVIPPCARPQTITVGEAVAADLSWSAGDGAVVALQAARAGQRARLERELRRVRPARLAGSGAVRAAGRVVEVACGNGATVAWGPCAGDRCDVAVRYPISQIPRAWRLHPWFRQRPPPPGEPEKLGGSESSRFLERIALAPPESPAALRQAARLARDLAGDLLDVLRLACPRERCGEPVRAAERDVEAFLLAGEATAASALRRGGDERGAVAWTWIATGGGAALDVRCVGPVEPGEMRCAIGLPAGAGLRLAYRAESGPSRREDDLVLEEPAEGGDGAVVGHIRFSRADGGRWVEIDGRALAVRAPAPRAP
jgi:hypothetical protein